MLFMTVFIALSYFAWFVAQTVTLFFVAEDDITKRDALTTDEISRLVRVICQQVAFFWILNSFSNYNIEIDKAIERRKKREVTNKASKHSRQNTPVIKVESMDETVDASDSNHDEPVVLIQHSDDEGD